MDMSQSVLASVLDVGESTVRNWESGRSKLTGPADRMLRVFYQQCQDGPTEIRKLVDRINQIDRELTNKSKRVEFVDSGGEWSTAA
ncbi:MAG: helix-turn-helix domain-containing protein [Acidiferrobacteraceae bacterium]